MVLESIENGEVPGVRRMIKQSNADSSLFDVQLDETVTAAAFRALLGYLYTGKVYRSYDSIKQ